MGTCRQCGAQVAVGNRFCTQCGTEAPDHDLVKRPAGAVPPPPPVELTRGVRPAALELEQEDFADPYGYEPRPRRTGVMVAVLALVVAVAAVAAWLVSGSGQSTTPAGVLPSGQPTSATTEQTPAPTEKAALASISGLLDQSAATRSVVGPAVAGVLNCSLDPATGAQRLQQAADARAALLQQLQALTLTSSESTAARGTLATAWQSSRSADLAFRTWAARRTGACKAGDTTDADYRSGVTFSAQADVAKRQFVTAWNPLAQQYGLPARSAASI
jgi:hypothetical protein